VKVVWSPTAVNRAYEAANYIARDKPAAALRWLEGLFAATDRLREFPESGTIVPELGAADYRQIIYRSHRVIYRVERSRVAILTVRHTAQLFDGTDVTG
jgi:toxin ParE1/3/4